MIALVARRARAQWQLLAALLAVVALGATLLGTCALLVTRTAERATEVAAQRATPEQVEVTAYTVTVKGPDARSVADDTLGVLTSALAPFPVATTTLASSVLRPFASADLTGIGAIPAAYLSGMADVSRRTALVEGRWPAAGATPFEAVVLEPTARALGIGPGSRVPLGKEFAVDPAGPLDVTVVGVVRALPGTGWERDPLEATGLRFNHRDSRFGQPLDAYGPFIVDIGDLLAGGSTLDRLEVTAVPDFATAAQRDLDRVAAALSRADKRLSATLGKRVQIERISSALPATLRIARNQQRVTAATVLAVAVLGGVLTAVALALAGRLTAGVRDGEATLLSALGVSRAQFALVSLAESAALAVLGAALAVPGSALLHAGLSRLPPLSTAGLRTGPALSGAQVLTVCGGALALATVLVVLAVRPVTTATVDSRSRVELLARSGADVMLVAFAGVGLWQLHAQSDDASSRTDAVRVLAPALLLVAGAALALRLARPALRGVERLAARSRGLALPLAAFEAARRPQAVAAGLLVGLACAAATFGTAYDATWQRSQRDQADLLVGTDLAIGLSAPPVAGQGATIGAALGGTVSPAVNRGIAIGQWIGGGGNTPKLVAVNTTQAGALIRGRLDDGRTWNDIGALLSPKTPVRGIAVPRNAPLTISGTIASTTATTVTPRLLFEDAAGLRTSCPGASLPLDGAAHPLPSCADADGLRLVAVALPLKGDPSAIGGYDPITQEYVESTGAAKGGAVSITVTVPGGSGEERWTAVSVPPVPNLITSPAVRAAGGGLTMTANVDLTGPEDAARTLLATAFEDPGTLPVAVSQDLADELSTGKGQAFSLTVGVAAVPVQVKEIVPTVPAAAGEAAILVDVDLLSRSMVFGGAFESVIDGYWVGRPLHAAQAPDLHIGEVTTRAAEAARLSGGPVRAGLPAVLRLLVPAAALLLLAGVVLHVTFDVRARAVEVARLRGLGMSRRGIRAVLLGQHAGVLLPLLLAGGLVGALATLLVVPAMVRSDSGAAPVPEVIPVWPWAAEAVVLAGLLVGCVLAIAAVVSVQARRADAEHLRVTS
ncbi:hypothetical protein Val02_71250 [Virgisporangium aliadipatigenens]|uniref:ABC3 transporter permease C-terminal domain-containing protein n=1 Tax=Virgisporangium aliadipatigenens TaxID=741659 RepID=A0A8J3YR06_9ACTN|nr:FtsX-like permease family protein [Virgisporangium aliadipatigenens]GIJ50239.1 hypothetical protein Val02_71250 [Virgisporangium aliadipatigenens]